MEYIVYKISNSVNNKIYFGVTQQELKVRWQQHKCNSNKKSYHLYNAIKKYGFKNFNIEVVFEANSKKEMLEKEIELIVLHKSNDRLFGYNNSTGGESSRKGCKLTQEQKDKISKYQKTRKRTPHSQETKLKIGMANKNNIISDSHKLAISKAKKGKPALNKKKIILNNEFVFSSLTDASNKTGVSITSISNNLNGLSKTTKIGIWRIYEHQN
jgi:group I intron endonuclease